MASREVKAGSANCFGDPGATVDVVHAQKSTRGKYSGIIYLLSLTGETK
jgi:hypothetical protein